MDYLVTMQTYLAVVEEGSFIAASQRLGITPQVVSKHIQALEKDLGVQLLNRTTRSLNQTEVGDRFARRCATFLDEFKDIISDVRKEHTEPRGILKLTVPVTFAEIYMSRILIEFSQIYPDISVEMRLCDDFSDLLDDNIDLALRIGKLTDSSVIAKKILDTKAIVCAAPSYLERAGRPKTPADIETLNCIIDTNRRTPRRWSFMFNGSLTTVAINGCYTVNSASAAIELGRAGGGVLMCPDIFIQKELQSGQLQPLFDQDATEGSGLYAMFHSTRYTAAKTRVFVDFITTWFKHNPIDGRQTCAAGTSPGTRSRTAFD